MSEFTTIDLSGWDRGDAERRAIARAVDAAASELGFFAILGHGVEASVIERARREAKAFFDLPASKKRAASSISTTARGWLPPGAERLGVVSTTATDPKESFSIGPTPPEGDRSWRFEPSGLAYAPNVWPPGRAGFRRALEDAYGAFSKLADTLVDVAALALRIDSGELNRRSDRPTSALRILGYPPAASQPEGTVLASAHADYGDWTILSKRAGRTGLEAADASGEWVEVIAPADALVVNVGDLLMRWSGGRWRSAWHRVVATEESDPAGEVSVVFFHQPNWDAVVYPLTEELIVRPEVLAHYPADAPEQHFGGVMVADVVFAKHRESVARAR